MSYGAWQHTPLWPPVLYALGVPPCGLCGPSVVAELITVGAVVGEADPWATAGCGAGVFWN